MSETLDMERILDKITKLLALGQSPNEEEAKSAIEKAHALLRQHNLSMQMLEDRESVTLDNTTYMEGQKIPDWKKIFLSRIAQFNYCGMYMETSRIRDTQDVWVASIFKLHLIGREANVTVARIMADYLFQAIDNLAKRSSFVTNTGTRYAYKKGVSETLISRMLAVKAREDMEASDSKALVVKPTVEIDEFYRDQNMDMVNIEEKTAHNNAWYAGRMDGNNVSLVSQIDSTASEHLALDKFK